MKLSRVSYKQQQLERELKDKKASFEREITARESKVQEQEREFDQLKLESQNFPQLLEQKVNEAVDKITQELNAKHEYLSKLKAKEVEGKIALYEQTNQSLLEIISEQKTLIEQLSEHSNFASNQAQDIALKAIDGTSKLRTADSAFSKKEVDA